MSLPFDVGSFVLQELELGSVSDVDPAWQPVGARAPVRESASFAGAEADDHELMRLIGVGDRAAFGLFCRRHGARCFAVAMHLLRNAADAEEVVQDVFMRVWRHAARWRANKAEVSTWLHRVVVNLCLDQMRRATRLSLSIEHAAEVMAADPSPEYAVGQRELMRVVMRAAATLPTRQRAALALVAGQGMECAEAAAAMNVSVGTMESLLVRARRQLRAALAEAVDGAPKGPAKKS
jgi:RNA polymerase sigma-70 factor (ECF subfamily)